MHAEDDVLKICFYCRKCEKCNKFYETMDECKAKGLLSFNKEVKNWEVIYRGKNKHFSIRPRDQAYFFYFSRQWCCFYL